MKVWEFSAPVAQVLHYLFEWLALLAGAQYYRYLKQRSGQGTVLAPGSFAVLVGCIGGAALGNKLVFWLEYPHLFINLAGDWRNWFLGQSIVGGLLGGLLGVELAKKIVGISHSTGDLFVFPILLGICIGRIGCFLSGLHDGTYGIATSLPWGVDFGDGVLRHPTQIYEILFALLLWYCLARVRIPLASASGLLFKIMLASYLCWRLLIDSLKPVPYAWIWGWSGIQCLCVLALTFYLPLLLRQALQWHQKGKEYAQAQC